MDKINDVIQTILTPGPALFVPVIIFVFALIVRVKIRQSIQAALTIGIAFVATGLLIDTLINWIRPAFQVVGKLLKFNTVDVGWITLATLAWAWPYAFLMFPIQILINTIMIWRKWTKTLNIDMWNVWHKPFIAMLVIGVVGGGAVGIILGFLVAIAQIVIELKNGDIMQASTYKITKIKDVTIPHAVGLFGAVLYPVDVLLNKIPFFAEGRKLNLKAKSKRKFGIFLENDIIGFCLGLLIGFIGWENKLWYRPFLLGIQLAALLSLLPIAAKFFVRSLNPITNKIQSNLMTKYKGRKLFVGLDFPILAGSQNLWIAMGIWTPITLGYAFLIQFSGQGIFPLAMIINTSLGIPALLITGGNLKKMIAMGFILTPVFLFMGTWAGSIITSGVVEHKVANAEMIKFIDDNKYISSSAIEMPAFRYIVPNLMGILTGKVSGNTIAGVCLFPCLVGLWVYYYMGMKKRVKNNYYGDAIVDKIVAPLSPKIVKKI